MKIYMSTIGQPNSPKTLHIDLQWKKPVSVLILVHVGLSLLCFLAAGIGFGDTVRNALALSGGEIRPQMLSGLLTYPFVHLSPIAFVISVGALWFFGSILQTIMPPTKVVFLYVVTTLLSGVAFLLSHFVFKVFSGYGVVMEGTFAGALGIMTAALVFFRNYQVRILNTNIPLWQIYTVTVILALVLISKPSLAYVLAYLAAIWFGGQYAASKLMLQERV